MRKVNRNALFVLAIVTGLLAGCDVPDRKSKQMNPTKAGSQRASLAEISSQYSGTTDHWRQFLACWRAEMGLSAGRAGKVASTWQASSVQGLSTSYRHFTEATDGQGWILPGDEKRFDDRVPQFFPIKEIGPFKKVSNATWKAWNAHRIGRNPSDELYYNYTNDQDEGKFREQHLDGLIVVGDLGHGAILALNPAERSLDGEMEAWYLSTKLPGALRFRSFAELMQLIYFMDHYPERDVSTLTAKDFVGTCAQTIFGRYRSF